MKKLIKKIIIKLLNKLFSAQIDEETFFLLRNTPVAPRHLKAYLEFCREQQDAYRSLKSLKPDSPADFYHNDPDGLFKNVAALMYYETNPSDLRAVLNLYQSHRDSETNAYKNDLHGFLENASTLMQYRATPSDLNAVLNFYRTTQGSDASKYLNNLEGFLENASTLMRYRANPAELDALLRFYRMSQDSGASVYQGNLNGLLENAALLTECRTTTSELRFFLDLHRSCQQRPGLLEDVTALHGGHTLFYSQEGEDLILSRIFNGRKDGLYVDIGAHHPKRFSNTYLFYRLGWRGINVEPNADSKAAFDELRPRDTNLNVAVGNTEAENVFYVFEEPALNTFSKPLADEYRKLGQKLLEERKIKTRKLASILDEHLNGGDRIDFMSIDVEDFELQVLESNDWTRFRPKWLLIEILNFDVNHPENFPVHNYVVDRGYEVWAKTFNTVFYKNVNAGDQL